MSFEDAIGAAFKKKEPDLAPHPPPPPVPDVRPFDNDFHGKEFEQNGGGTGIPLPPPVSDHGFDAAPRRKKKRDPSLLDRDGIKKKKVSKTELIMAGTAEERREVYERIMKYVDSFPEYVFPEAMAVSELTPLPDLQFTLARIQQRVNAKQELQVLQSGLVTSCMALEFGSTMVPGNPVMLNGFGQNIATNIAMFDDCLRQIACKYGGKMVISVEAQLGMMLMRVAANTHITNMCTESEKKPPVPIFPTDPVKDDPEPQCEPKVGGDEVGAPEGAEVSNVLG